MTILADSFLEDLGSTNGTLVNGKPIAKHFLPTTTRSTSAASASPTCPTTTPRSQPLPPDIARHQLRGLHEKVEPARPLPQVEVPRRATGRPQLGGARAIPCVGGLRARAAASRRRRRCEQAAKCYIEDLLSGRARRGSAASAQDERPRAQFASRRLFRPRPTRRPRPPSPPPAGASPRPSVQACCRAPAWAVAFRFQGPSSPSVASACRLPSCARSTRGYLLIPVEGKDTPRINGARGRAGRLAAASRATPSKSRACGSSCRSRPRPPAAPAAALRHSACAALRAFASGLPLADLPARLPTTGVARYQREQKMLVVQALRSRDERLIGLGGGGTSLAQSSPASLGALDPPHHQRRRFSK